MKTQLKQQIYHRLRTDQVAHTTKLVHNFDGFTMQIDRNDPASRQPHTTAEHTSIAQTKTWNVDYNIYIKLDKHGKWGKQKTLKYSLAWNSLYSILFLYINWPQTQTGLTLSVRVVNTFASHIYKLFCFSLKSINCLKLNRLWNFNWIQGLFARLTSTQFHIISCRKFLAKLKIDKKQNANVGILSVNKCEMN